MRQTSGAGRVACRVGSIGLLLLLWASAGWTLRTLEQYRPPEVRAEELSYLPKGQYLKIAALGYDQIVADLLWIKAVQHFGTRKQDVAGYRWAYHAVDVVTDLDPTFVFAYQASGTVLGVWAGMMHESISILTKGMRHNPDVWQLPFVVGYDYFYELCDPINGAKYFKIASRLPGAPAYLPALAARLDVVGGDPDAALEFLERFRQQVRDERLREVLAHRIREVVAERDIRVLEGAVQRYTTQYGARPTNLNQLVSRGIIRQIPDEPFGGAYRLNTSDGTIASTGLRVRLKVHRNMSCSQLRGQHERRVGS